jgi:hypothetical protein
MKRTMTIARWTCTGGILCLWAGLARASLPDLAGIGTTGPALAGAGATTLTGYEATYVNPAGIHGTSRRLTLGVVHGAYKLDQDGAPYPIDNTSGLLIGAGLPLPMGGPLRDRLSLGFAFYLPFGVVNRARIPYPDVPWPALLDSRTQVVSVLVGAGARLFRGLSAGVSVLALAALVGETQIAADPSGRIGAASQSQLTVAYAPILGLRYQAPTLPLRLALVYRAQSQSSFRNTVRSNLGDAIPVELPLITVAGVGQFDPHQVAAEAAMSPTGSLTLIAGLTWKHWSAYPPPIQPATAGADPVPEPGFHDTAVPRVALTWRPPGSAAAGAPGEVELRLGYAFDPSPAPQGDDEAGRTLLDASRHVIGAGVGHRLPLRLPLRLDAYVQWHQLAGSNRLQGGFALGGLSLGVDL